MRFLSARLIEPEGKRKDGKYVVAVEVTGKDINHFEDMAMCYIVNGRKPEKGEFGQQYDESHDLTPEYNRFMRKLWKVFHMPWKLYDTCGCAKPGDFKKLLGLAHKYRDELDFTSPWHRGDKMVLDDIKKDEAERKAKLPPEKPWVEDPLAKEQHKILKKRVPKTVSYYMHCEGNGIMGPLDEVSFFKKGDVKGWIKPEVIIKLEKEKWVVKKIFPICYKDKVEIPLFWGNFEDAVKRAMEVIK